MQLWIYKLVSKRSHLFTIYLLNAYGMPGTVQNAGTIQVNNNNNNKFLLTEIYILMEEVEQP